MYQPSIKIINVIEVGLSYLTCYKNCAHLFGQVIFSDNLSFDQVWLCVVAPRNSALKVWNYICHLEIACVSMYLRLDKDM